MKRANHEMWHICKKCAHEYDLRVYGYDCPNCSEIETVSDFATATPLRRRKYFRVTSITSNNFQPTIKTVQSKINF